MVYSDYTIYMSWDVPLVPVAVDTISFSQRCYIAEMSVLFCYQMHYPHITNKHTAQVKHKNIVKRELHH